MPMSNEELRLQTAARLAALTLANAFIAQAELAEVDQTFVHCVRL